MSADGAHEQSAVPPLPPDVPQIPVPVPVEPASADVAPVDTSVLPGEHRGGFQREMTAPVAVTEPVRQPGQDVRWAPPPPAPLPHSAAWALTFAVLGLVVSLLVGWGFPIGLVGAGLAIVALRRPWESRGVAVWALCLSVLSLAYSAGWLWWASTQGPLFS